MSNKFSRLAARAAQSLHLVVYGHILNPMWKDRDERRKQRYKATVAARMGYLRRYSPEVSKIVPMRLPEKEEPEHAFTIWFQGEENAPELVKACFRSMRHHLKQPVKVLDEKAIFDWIELPDYIVRKWREGKIPHAHFSDMCRIELLYRHGGLWFDATDYVTAPVPQWIMDEDVFLFTGGKKIRGSYGGVQNCFIRGKKGNPLLGIWREANFAYWKEENSKIDYFVHHLLLKLSTEVNPIAAEAYRKMPHVEQDPTHTLWGDHAFDPYDKARFEALTKDSFFQKTNYKDRRLQGDRTGTIAEYIISGEPKARHAGNKPPTT